VEIDQQTIIFASIGDLEVTRRTLMIEIQARDQKIAELEAELRELKGEDPPQTIEAVA